MAGLHTDRPYRALRVPRRTRLRLRWYARADRRAGLPVGLSAETTPVLAELVARYGEQCEAERIGYRDDVEPWEVRLGQLEAQIESLHAALNRHAREVAQRSVRPTEEWLAQRYPGEDQMSAAATRERRAVAHRRAFDAALAAQAETLRMLDDARAEQAELEARRLARADAARSRVGRLRELTHLTAAVYRRALVRRHPERDALVSRWVTDLCALPAWAAAESPLPTSESTGASA